MDKEMEGMLGKIVIYLSLVFRPRLLVRIAREHLEGTEMVKAMSEELTAFNNRHKEARND
jgi:hypothetical protein